MTACLGMSLLLLASCQNSVDYGGEGGRIAHADGTCTPGEGGEGCTTPITPNSVDQSSTGPVGPGDPETAIPSGQGNDACVSGDKLNIQWAGPVKECLIDQGKTYNFEMKKCTEMRKAQFECTWTNVIRELEERGLITKVLREDADNGAKLISCGQSKDSNRIVVQWVKLPESGKHQCDGVSVTSSITTGCYTLYQGSKPPEPTTEEEKAKRVYACMNEL